MTYKKTLYHKFLDWQLGRVEKNIDRLDRIYNFWERLWKEN